MNIAFINPPGNRFLYRGTICTYISKSRYVWKPKDFILLSSMVPPDWKIHFLDSSINGKSAEYSLEWIKDKSPDIIVMAASSISWEDDSNFLIKLRQEFPLKTIYTFGEVYFEPKAAEFATKYVDAIIRDPLRFDFTTGKSTHISGKKDTKQIRTQYPRHWLFNNWKYRWPFIRHFKFASVYTQFGCPFSCSYCTESLTNVTYRPAVDVLSEMRILKESGYKEILIGDATFGTPRDNAIEILQGMIEERFNFSWSSYTHPSVMTEEMMDMSARSGCHTFVIGIDSADTNMLSTYGRYVSRPVIENFIREAHRRGISVCGDFIIGFNGESEKSCKETIQMALDIGVDYASFNIATPLLGSSLRQEGTELGFDTAGNNVMGTDTMSPATLVGLRNHAVRRFYLRPSYIWKRMTGIKTWQQLLLQANEGLGVGINLLKARRKLTDGHL